MKNTILSSLALIVVTLTACGAPPAGDAPAAREADTQPAAKSPEGIFHVPNCSNLATADAVVNLPTGLVDAGMGTQTSWFPARWGCSAFVTDFENTSAQAAPAGQPWQTQWFAVKLLDPNLDATTCANLSVTANGWGMEAGVFHPLGSYPFVGYWSENQCWLTPADTTIPDFLVAVDVTQYTTVRISISAAVGSQPYSGFVGLRYNSFYTPG